MVQDVLKLLVDRYLTEKEKECSKKSEINTECFYR